MVETAFSVLMSMVLGVAGVGLVVLGRRMSQRRLPPNSWAGVRYFTFRPAGAEHSF